MTSITKHQIETHLPCLDFLLPLYTRAQIGKLEACHSENEYVDIPDVQRVLAVCTLATWALTQ